MIRLSAFLLAAALLALPALTVHAASACHAQSGATAVPLVELYTSEGCDSCPPAERWLASAFRAPKGASPPGIALEFHVDYWDRLGWVDRFATHRYTERQYAAMRANDASFVFTPQVLLQGRDFPAWQHADAAALITAVAQRPARARVTLDADIAGSWVSVGVSAQVDDPSQRVGAELFVAYVDSGLASSIGAGENRGLRMIHDHVVRMFKRIGATDAGAVTHTSLALRTPVEAGSAPTVVAFVQRASDGEVLQALALPLSACAPPVSARLGAAPRPGSAPPSW
jgi:hypothetical protein